MPPSETTRADELVADIDKDVYVRMNCDLLVIGDSIMTDRHHKSGSGFEADNAQNKIGGIIPPFSLSGWLRHGMETLLLERGASVCHPGEASANFKSAEMYERDFDAGYHAKGECTDTDDDPATGCTVIDLFGGFERQPGKFMRRPIQFSPLRPSEGSDAGIGNGNDLLNGRAEGHYRKINRNVVSRNVEDARTPLRPTEYDAVANLSGTWHLKFRTLKPEFVALLNDALELLDDRNTDFMHQLGGARNFGGGIVETGLINPLYDGSEVARLFDRAKGKTPDERKTVAMAEKDDTWADEYLSVFRDALEERVDERVGAGDGENSD